MISEKCLIRLWYNQDENNLLKEARGVILIYALDIGTRTVVGVLAEKFDNSITVYDKVMKEHEERAMLDGAIHDVNKVAKVVEGITRELAEKNDVSLSKVSVALAGRFLKTSLGESELDVSNEHSINRDTVRMLEMEAINESISSLETDGREMYCVGYSVLYYTLDDEWIKNLEGQRGRKATVKVIAAFLPAYVVNAMMNVLEKTDLTPRHITLEPIAAINLVVPPDLRKLNIVLVDVGAGTSDIAVSRDGTVIAYGMVPMAGDEITEKLSEQYLIDFKTAERIKRTLSTTEEEEIEVKDILDSPVKVTKEEFLEVIRPVIEEITSSISDEVLNLNGKPPVAVMIVGGGARVPGFPQNLAKRLDLPENRVALKTVENIEMIEDKTDGIKGSEYITPISIANSVDTNTGSVFVRVVVNEKAVDLMGMDNKNTIMQALLQMGYRVEEIIGKPGPAIAYDHNGDMKIVKGKPGKEARITINGKKAGIHTRLQHGDVVNFESGKEGEPADLYVSNIVDPVSLVVINDKNPKGQNIDILPPAKINDELVTSDVQIKDNDSIVTSRGCSLEFLFEKMAIEPKEFIRIYLNDKPKSILIQEILAYRDNKRLELKDQLYSGDVIQLQEKEYKPKVRDLIDETDVQYCKVIVNSREMEIPSTTYNISVDGTNADLETALYDGAVVDLEITKTPPKVIDLLGTMDIDPSSLKSFNIKVNGEKAAFMDLLTEGDNVEIELEKEKSL